MNKSVPQTNNPQPKHIQQEFTFRVYLAPAFQAKAGHMDPAERRAMASELRQFAHQLEVTAQAMETQGARKRKKVPRLPAELQALN